MRLYPLVLIGTMCALGCGGSAPDSNGPGGATPTPAGSSRSLFEQSGSVHEIKLQMEPADWAALRQNFLTNQYYAADVTIDGQTIRQVGIRSRGYGSRNENKPGLKVDFNKYVTGQEFQGYKALVLDNLTQDPSGLHERMACEVFEAMGIVAPKTAHAQLTVNDAAWGLYALTEAVSKPMLQARFGEDGGNLFDYEYAVPYDFAFLGSDPARYVPVPFQPQTNETSLDPSALVGFIQTVNEAPDSGFLDQVERYTDVQRFLTYIAVENAIVEKDGFIGDWGMNNFYLYQFNNTTRFILIPWDKDVTFTEANWPVYNHIDENVLTRRLLAIKDVRNSYDSLVRKAVNSYVNDRWLRPRLDTAYNQIREAMRADTKKPWTNDKFESEVALMRQVISAREASVMQQIPPP